MHYIPLAWPFFLGLLFVAGFVFVLLEVGVLSYAYQSMGVDRRYMFVLLAGSLLGSYINIPAAELPAERIYTEGIVTFFGMQYVVPQLLTEPKTIIALNLGGAVIPTLLSVYLMVKHRIYGLSAVAVFIVAGLVHLVAQPVPGVGIVEPTFMPSLVTTGVVLLLSRQYAAPLAYIAGSLGTLIGADLLNLGRIRGLGAPVASIGGAGTFDGIFLTGILAVLLAGLLTGGRQVAGFEPERGTRPVDACAMHSRTPFLWSLVLCGVALAWAAHGQGSHGRVPGVEDTTAQPDAGDRAHPELAALFASHDWFKLRDAVERSPDSPAFYRGAVACAFNEVDAAERHFRAVIETPSDVQQALEAHGLLAHAYMRTGRYRFTHAHLAAMQKLIPETPGLEAGVALFSALSHSPDLSAKAGRLTGVQMTEDFFIPVAVNGRPAKYGFDSGVDISLISETEAKRLGLPIHGVATSTFQDGASGNEVPVRFVVADRLTVGGFELRHVAFLVVRKDALPFVDLPPDKQGMLGIPVLVALGGLRWNGERVLRVGSYPSRRGGERPNMCFHGVTPVVEGMVGAQTINMWLDTGASRTYLTQRFAQRFPKVVGHGATETSVRLRGVGGSTEVRVANLPELTLSVGGADLLLCPAQVLPKDERVDRDWYDVWLGMDLLGRRRTVNLDFKSLRLSLE